MIVSERGKALLRELEGLQPRAYLDSGGAPTIGVGHLLTRSERTSGKLLIAGASLDLRHGITEGQARALLDQDLGPAEQAVNTWVDVPLTQNQFDALVMFCFNVGIQAFINSTLRRRLNQGEYDAVPEQLRRWVMDNGVRVKGLVNRREKEIALWTGAVS